MDKFNFPLEFYYQHNAVRVLHDYIDLLKLRFSVPIAYESVKVYTGRVGVVCSSKVRLPTVAECLTTDVSRQVGLLSMN